MKGTRSIDLPLTAWTGAQLKSSLTKPTKLYFHRPCNREIIHLFTSGCVFVIGLVRGLHCAPQTCVVHHRPALCAMVQGTYAIMLVIDCGDPFQILQFFFLVVFSPHTRTKFNFRGWYIFPTWRQPTPPPTTYVSTN